MLIYDSNERWNCANVLKNIESKDLNLHQFNSDSSY